MSEQSRITPQEFESFLLYAREHKVQEFSIGDTHVLFSHAALVPLSVQDEPPPPERKVGSAPLPPETNDAELEESVKKLMDDPDLFLEAEGGSGLPT